jgi:DNA-binding NtrC family response regulator
MISNNIRRILLVDDEEDVTLVFELMLRKEGYMVDAFTNPISALSAFKPGYYDLIILDYRMAGVDGIKFIQDVKKVDRLIRAILITAWQQQLIGIEIQKLFIKVLSKPILPEVLIKEVELVLKGV